MNNSDPEVSLDAVVPSFNLADISPADKRRNFNTYIAGSLAITLWLFLGGIIIWHTYTIQQIYREFWTNNSSKPEEVEKKIDKAANLVDETTKTLYTMLVPLATAVTSFYFGSMLSSSSNNRSDNANDE